MRRRSFFLLEVLIAVILVGGFAYLSIQGAFSVISKQRKLLKELENSRVEDLKRMELIVKYWNVGKCKIKDGDYSITCKEGKKDKYYLLEIEKGKKFSYFIERDARS